MTEPGPPVRKPKSRIPLRRWALWGLVLVVGDLIFYVLLTPVWLGLRMLAWVAEFRGRRRQGRNTPCV
jgi:hypothetical protein